jgi:hypothetical protein
LKFFKGTENEIEVVRDEHVISNMWLDVTYKGRTVFAFMPLDNGDVSLLMIDGNLERPAEREPVYYTIKGGKSVDVPDTDTGISCGGGPV